MMAQKHLLQELLKEDQEPFLLKNYISDRLSQLKIRPNNPSKTNLNNSLLLKKQHIQQNSRFPINLCKNACFLSFHNTTISTPDITKSPLFQFTSPSKSPCMSQNTIFLHVPSRTATLLVEAASKIQKHSNTKQQKKSNRFGLCFELLLKKLTKRGRNNKKREIKGNNNNNNVKVKDLLRFHSSNKICYVNGACSCEVGFTCSCNGNASSAVWSESNEDNKSLDSETLSNSNEYFDFIEDKENTQCVFFDDKKNGEFFCESPFRFSLERSPTAVSGCRTLEFSSPVSSPIHHRTEDKETNEVDKLNKFQSSEEEEEKEQCSPVSVLDPPFEDDDDVHENYNQMDGFHNAQRAKQQLLYKLGRFESIAELDPLEFEKRMVDQEEYEYETFMENDECEDENFETLCEEKELRQIVFEKHVPEDLKRLVFDLIIEEEREFDSSKDRDMIIRRVTRRLDLWKEVEFNTIDMMIQEDFCREECGWKKNTEQIRDLAREVEFAIFGFLVEEFSEDLLSYKKRCRPSARYSHLVECER
ncbi:hypothetical protein Lal_00038078 [Lupinus albus]|uniref:Uncharacterized protein n=1 Tax=Lupinus albus TaxID=3870 RepID=A0A6A4R2M5_LUPAL|nr:hypothetical protein Lalb_Chr02g0155221 [Lupinus albus]KAF1877769.1 hypothetical protein Lal_00038078 [Lupinus albus]